MAPIVVGLLLDFPQPDEGAAIEEAVRVGIDDGAGGGLDRPVELRTRQARGLPAGSAHDVERTVAELVEGGVLAIVGPSISDNGLVVRDLVDRAAVPCINYTGGERTRSEWMFHYQVGSLEEEPIVLAEHLRNRSIASAAVAYDHSPVGRRYAECFADAAARLRIDVTGSVAVSPLAEDLTPELARLRGGDPGALVYLGLGVAARALSLAVEAGSWSVPVVANSSLMFGYARRDWRPQWEGWTYVDTVADDNPERERLRASSPRTAAGPVGVAVYDIGRLLGAALARTEHLTRAGVREALHGVKRLPAASGGAGTTMGFGVYDHAALKGPYLVLRRWSDGRTVQVHDEGGR
jgi:ABC-type branched-subunit amino acid transport system substrate-binding protein